MKVLYFDCFSGAAGDMILGALLDAGASESTVRDALGALNLDGWSLSVEEAERGSLRATRANVETRVDERRSYSDIVSLLTGAAIDDGLKRKASDVFRSLGEAEARVHGVGLEEVHFHEVGAVDAIVDIVGCCAALLDLDPDLVICSPIRTGRGIASMEHGTIPVPSPAVTELLRDLPIEIDGEGELITPTGAALLARFCDRAGAPPPFRLTSTGYGAGSRDPESGPPDLIRVLVGTTDDRIGENLNLLIETNLDDFIPELVPFAIERALAAGAQDAWTSPILMKKGRPALTLSVLVARDALDAVLEVIYTETSTLGVRISEVGKDELDRKWLTVQVEGYDVRVKLGIKEGRVTSTSPEYEDAAKVARVTGLPLKDVYERALRAARGSTI